MNRLIRLTAFLTRHTITDVAGRRSWLDVTLALLAIAACTAALLVVIVFTEGLYRFVDERFLRVRPIIGSVFVSSTAPDSRFSPDEMRSLKSRVLGLPDIPSITWVSTLGKLQFQPDQKTDFLTDAPRIWAVPYRSPLFEPASGIRYLPGGSPHEPDPKAQRRFGVLVNVSYLQECLKYSEQQVRAILRGDPGVAPPTMLYVHFPPLPVRSTKDPKAESSKQEIGNLGLSVRGYFSIRDKHFPHILMTPEVAGAYYLKGESWEDGYTHQFVAGEVNPKPLVDVEELQRKDLEPDPDRVVTLDDRDRLIATLEGGQGRDRTGFGVAILLLKPSRQPGHRSQIQQELERPLPVARVTPTRKTWTDLEAGKLNGVARLLKQAGIEIPFTDLASERTNGESGWRFRQKSTNISFVIRRDGDAVRIERLAAWRIDVPDDTVSEALNQVTRTVDFYSVATRWIVLVLSGFVSVLFGVGHVNRRRKDIGILKTCGLSPVAVGAIYGGQVLLIAAAGFVVGLLASIGLQSLLEPKAQDALRALTIDGLTSQAKILQWTWVGVGRTFLFVLAGTGCGVILPCWNAMTVNPIDDLQTGL